MSGIKVRFIITVCTVTVYIATSAFALVHAHVQTATDECDKESISLEIGDNPILRELYKSESVHKCNVALTGGYLRTAKVYWHEVACIEASNKKSDGAASTSQPVRLIPTLKHIIRDYVATVLVPGSSYMTCNIRMLLEFMQHTNISEPQPYEFLLNEFKMYPELMYHRDNLVFELGFEIKSKFGVESSLFKALPAAVQQILSSKQVKLQNSASRQYLAFQEFDLEQDEESQSYVNAVMVPSIANDKSTAWSFSSSLVPPDWEAGHVSHARTSYFSMPPVYQAQLQASVKCSRPNCTSILSENDTKAHDLVIAKSAYFEHIIVGPSQDLMLRLASDNSILIKRRRPNHLYLAVALTDSVSGGLRFLPETFYRYSDDSMAEYFHLDADLEIFNRTVEEQAHDLFRNEWIVSLA